MAWAQLALGEERGTGSSGVQPPLSTDRLALSK